MYLYIIQYFLPDFKDKGEILKIKLFIKNSGITKPPHKCAAALSYKRSVLLVLSVLVVLVVLSVLVVLLVLTVLLILIVLTVLLILIVLVVLVILVILIVIHTDMLLFSSEKIFFISTSDINEYDLSAFHSFEFSISDKYILCNKRSFYSSASPN